MNRSTSKISIFFLFFGLIIYSFTGIFMKLASNEVFLSYKFIVYFFFIFICLAIYAIIWQQALKYVDLSVALAFKPIVLVLNAIWAMVLFHEILTLRMIIGLLLIFLGIIIVGIDNV